MRYAVLLSFFLIGCAQRPPAPKASKKEPTTIATASLANGKVKISALKVLHNQNVCFEIKIVVRGKREDALPSNWSAVWVDQRSHYYFLSMNQRNPASPPKALAIKSSKGTHKEWTNYFRSCARRTSELKEVKSLVLTPKDLPYNRDLRSLELKWN